MQFLTALKQWVAKAAAFRMLGGSETYNLKLNGDHAVFALAVELGGLKFRFFIGRIGPYLCVTSRRELMEELAKAEAEAKGRPAAEGPAGNAMIRLHPENWDRVLPGTAAKLGRGGAADVRGQPATLTNVARGWHDRPCAIRNAPWTTCCWSGPAPVRYGSAELSGWWQLHALGRRPPLQAQRSRRPDQATPAGRARPAEHDGPGHGLGPWSNCDAQFRRGRTPGPGDRGPQMRRTLASLLGFVAGRGFAFFGEVARRPEQAPRDQVEVAGVGDGLVVVAEGGGEDAGLAAVGVGPGDDASAPSPCRPCP